MLPRPRTIVFDQMRRAIWLVGTLLLSCSVSFAEPNQTRVVCRENINQPQREDLATRLKTITGWSDLRFDRDGMLRLGINEPVGGSAAEPVGGSAAARTLLAQSAFGSNFIVLEDASNRPEVAFARVIAGNAKRQSPEAPPAFVVQIDFMDFKHVVGDRRALQAFDAAWVLLHELDHVVNNSVDPNHLGETGDCENHINQMRRESDLPERAAYFFTYLPHADMASMTRLVRLGFEQKQPANRKKRYWLMWDAKRVGGLTEEQIVALR